MTKWYKCPRCVRYTATLINKGYVCNECEKNFSKEEFQKQSKKEFGEIQFESEH